MRIYGRCVPHSGSLGFPLFIFLFFSLSLILLVDFSSISRSLESSRGIDLLDNVPTRAGGGGKDTVRLLTLGVDANDDDDEKDDINVPLAHLVYPPEFAG